MLHLLVIALSGCSILDVGDDDPPPDHPAPPDPQLLGAGDWRIARGTSFVAPVRTAVLGEYDLATRDPQIATVRVVDANHFEIKTHAPGATEVTARRRATGEIEAIAQLTSVPVHFIELRYRAAPQHADPVSALAGVVQSSDAFCLSYLDAGRGLLAGTGAFATRGAAIAAGAAVVNDRISETFAPHSACVGVQFKTLGIGELALSVDDATAPTLVVPIEVVAEPDNLELAAMVLHDRLVPAPDPLAVHQYAAIDAIFRTADGRYVGGADAKLTWSTSASTSGRGGEQLFKASAPGRYGITAARGALTTTLTLTVQ